MKFTESRMRMVWYVSACLLAVCTYFYGLDSQHIPKNGDEYVYPHITRVTAGGDKLLLIWIAAMFLSFCLPNQRSGRYLLAAMPAVALLFALNWQQIGRKVFIVTLLLAGAIFAGIVYLVLRLQAKSQMYPYAIWLLAASVAVLLEALPGEKILPPLTSSQMCI